MDASRVRLLPLALCFGLLLGPASCRPDPPEVAPAPSASRGYLITSERLAATGASSVWEGLRRTVRFAAFRTGRDGRPGGIQARGPSSMALEDGMKVFVDYQPLANIRILDDLPIAQVDRIQILSGLDATTFFGTDAGDGVILIFMRAR